MALTPQVSPATQHVPAMVVAQPFAPTIRRLAAALIDLALLWFVTELLAAFYEEEFIALGRGGRFIGALFFLAYIGGQNSTFTNGRTFGKRICGLRAVTLKGEALTLERSIARAALVLIPFMTQGIFAFPVDRLSALALHVSLALASVGYGAILVASYIFSGRGGQAIHDRLMGTVVVLQEENILDPLKPSPQYVWRRAAALVWLTLCGAVAGAQWWWWGGSRWNDIVAFRSPLLALEGVQRADIFMGSFYFRNSAGGREHTKYLEVRVFFHHKLEDFERESARIATVLFDSANPTAFDAIRITVGYEFDLLLARRRWQQSWVRTPSAWRDFLLARESQSQAQHNFRLSHKALPR